MARGAGSATEETEGTEGGRLHVIDVGVVTRTPGRKNVRELRCRWRESRTDVINYDVTVGQVETKLRFVSLKKRGVVGREGGDKRFQFRRGNGWAWRHKSEVRALKP